VLSEVERKTMKVLVDCTQISRLKAGVGVYAQNLLNELAQVDSEIALFLLVQDDDPDLDFSKYPNVKLIRVKAKICRKLLIPIPGRGYWAKKAAGKPVPKQPALPL